MGEGDSASPRLPILWKRVSRGLVRSGAVAVVFLLIVSVGAVLPANAGALSPAGGSEQTAPEKSSSPDVPVNVFAIPTVDGTEVSWKSPAKSPNAPDATAFTLVSCGPFQVGSSDFKNATSQLCESQQSRELIAIPARQRVEPDPSSNLPVDPFYVLRPDGTFETVVKCKPSATQFCVIAVGSVADSGKSGPVVVGSGGIAPEAPKTLTIKATATGSGLELSWTAPADVAQANEMPALAQSFEVWRDDVLVERGIEEPHYVDESCGVARRCNEKVFAITAAGRSAVLEGAAVTSGTKVPTISATGEILSPGTSAISGSLGHGSEDQRPVDVTVTPVGDLAGRVTASPLTLAATVADGTWSAVIPASVSPGRYSLIAQQGLLKSDPMEVGIAPIVPLRASISGMSSTGVPQVAFGPVVVGGDATPSPPASSVAVREMWGSLPSTVGARTQAELASWFDAAMDRGKAAAVTADVSADGQWVSRVSTSNGLGQRHVLEVSQIVPGVGLSRVFVEFDLLSRPSIIPISPTPSILIRTSAFSPQATAPLAPTALVATPANSSASIAFTAGANGGAAITNYQYQVGAGAWTALSPADAVSPVTIPGLVNGTAYSIKLRAVNSAGFGATSTAVTVTPRRVPDAPTSLVATPADRSASISFAAGANGGSAITNYQYRVGTGAWTALNPADAASPVTIPGLVNGSTYSIKLRAVNAAGFGAESAPVTVIPLVPSAAPTSLVATAGNGTVSIAFVAGAAGTSPITNYEYQLGTGAWTALSPPDTTSPITISGLQNGTAYSIKLRARGLLASGNASLAVSATPRILPSAPTSLVATPGNGTASIAFTAGTPDTGAITNYEYQLNGGSWIALAPADTSSPVAIAGLVNGTAYSIKLRGVSSYGGGDASAAVTVTPRVLAAAPTSLVATPGNGSASIAFTAGAAGTAPITNYEYKVGTGTWTALSPADAVSPVTIPGLTNGNFTSVALRPVTSFGAGTSSTTVTVTPRTLASPPTELSAQYGDKSISISFTPSDDGGASITNYEYQVVPGNLVAQPTWPMTWTPLSPADAMSPVIVSKLADGTALVNGTSYTARLRAVNAAGKGSPSARVVETPRVAPLPPTALVATPGNQSASIAFSPGAAGTYPIISYQYQLKPADNSTDYGALTATSPVTTGSPIIIRNLTNGVAYKVRIAAVNLKFTSSVSAEVTVTPRTTPSEPTALVVTPGDRSASIAFTPGSDGGSPITAYQYQRTTGAVVDAWTTFSTSAATSSVSLTNLSNDQTYSYKLRAVNAAGNGAESSAVTVRPGGIPAAPTALVAVSRDGAATISFTAPPVTGLPISAYTVSTTGPSPKSFTCTSLLGVPPPSCTLNGLTNGQSYSFTVTARNSAGTSPSSVASSSIVIGAPQSPLDLTATPRDGSVQIDWTAPPTPTGMYINGYEVTAVGDSTKRCTASGALPGDTQPLRCEISGLTNGVSYSFIARASAVTTTSPGVSVTGLYSAATSSVRPSGLPSAPTPVTAYSLPGGAVVAWSTPATTGGTSITGYKVTVRPNGLVPGVVVGDPIVTAFDATARLARISSLVNSISYSIEVAAVNDAGSGPAGTTSSFWAPVTTKPLDVVAVPGDSSATVTWTEPAIVPVPIQTYTVTATNYYDDSDVVEQTADSSPFIFTGLRNGLTYSFTVTANNDAGASPVSDASSSIIPAALPSVPTETSLDVAPGTVSVFWQRPISDGGRPIESYIVELATNQPGRTPATKVVTESSAWVYSGQGSYLATQWSGLTNGYDYTVRIAATTAAGNSEFVTIGTVTPRGRTTAPSLISLTPSNGTLTANFSAPSTDGGSPVTEYVVTDGVGHSCTIDAIAHPGVTECTIAGLVNGQTYSFKVTATNSFGSTDSASRMSGAPTALVPGTPTNVVGVGVDRLPGSDVIYPGIIQVSWATPSTDGGAPIIKYVVTDRWNSANTCSAWVTPLDPTPTSCAMTGFVAGYGYTFRVVAWNEVGASVASSVSAPAFAGGTPNAPEITGITGGSRSVDVGGGFMNYATATATVSPGATNGRPITGYRLKAVDPSNQYTQYFTSATATIVADQLTAGRSYRLSVQAQNDFGYGDWSPQSSTIYASYPPLAATGVTAVPTEGGATISYSPPSWNGSTATYAVTVNDLTLSTSWTEPAESYSTSVSGLTNGHSYSFAITATNFAGAGPMSGASAPVTPNLMPNAPRNIAPTIGDRSISVAFDAPTSRDGATVTAYKVAVTNISSRAVVFATGAASPIQVSGLTNGAGYQVSVVAVNGAVDGQAATFGSTVTPAGTPVMLQPSPTYYEDGSTTVTLTTINLAGGSFIKYTVYVSEATTPLKLVKTVETTTSPVVISGLTNGTRYAIQAKVTTTGGSSSLMTQGGASILPVGRPSAPSILNVVASVTSAAVSIADPASTGGSAITGYTVTATSSTDASRTRTSSGSGSPVTVTGLIPGDTYLFSAVASNAAGSGGNARGGSGPSSPSVPAAPSAPTSITASEGDGSTQISWIAPVSAFGETVVSYRATASPGGAFCESTVLHNCLITGLTNYTPYQVTVSARNAGGSTSASSVEVTPKPVTSASSAPSAPRSVTVDPRSSSLVVTWAMPLDDGGGAIRSFTATASPGGGSCTSQALTTCAISGVDPYALYTVSVTATNSFGTSSAGVSTEVSACGLPASLSVAANGCDPIQAAATSVRAEFVDGGVKVSWNPQYRLTSIATAAPSGGSCSADYWTAPRNADNTVYCVILGSFDPATSFRVSSGSWPPDTSGSVHAKRITLNVPSATRDLIPHATGTISGGSSVLVVAAPISCANVLSCAGAVVFPTSATGGAFDVALSGLSEGSYNVFAADSDTSATLPYTAPQVMTVDRTQPRLDVNGSSTGIQTVFGPTAKVFGTAECAASTSFGIDWYAGPTASGSVIATTNPVRAISVGTATCSFESDLAGLADGTYTTVSSMTDAAGNSTTVEMVVVVDNMAPALSVATPIAGSTEPSGVFVVQGAAAIDATDRSVVSLSAINGADSIARDIAVNSDGSWSASLVLSPGEWSFAFTQSDLAGNSTVVTRTLTVGVVGESVRIELPASDAIVGQATTVAGWAIAGSTVSLVSGSTDLGSVVADELGAWSKAVVLPSDAEEIAATVFDETDVVALSIGTRSTSVDVRFPAPSGQTNGRLLFGSGPASTSLTVQIDSTSTVVQTDSSGMWSIPLSSFSEGIHVVTASDGSTSDSGSITIERAPPTVGFVQPQADHTRDRTVTLRSSDFAGNSQSVLLRYYSGTITSGDPIFTDRVEFLNGVAAASMPSQLSDGQWTLVAQRQDASGNVGSASVTFDFDTTAPTVSSNLRPAMPGPLVISGAASANAGDRAPVITIDGQSWTAPTTGPFSYQPTPAIVSGTHTVTVSQSDTAGNVESVTLSVIVDGVPPELTLESFFRSGASSVSFIGRARYNDGPVTAVATPDDASLATPAVANLVPDVNGYWVGSLRVAPGFWTIAFTRTDFAGNDSTIIRRYLSVDNAPDLVIDSPMGPTRNGVVTVSGTTSTESWRASTVQIEIRRVSNGSVAYSADALVVNGQYSSTTPSLAEGSYEFTVTRNDSVFPISRSGTFSVDTIAPTPLFDSVTAEPIAQLCGTAGTASGDLQSIGLVWTAGGTGSTSTQTVTAQNGRFCAAPPWSGLWSVQATQFDGTGSSSISASATFDVVAPVVTVATTSATTDSASPAPWAGTISGTAGFAIGDEQSVTLSLTLDSSAGYGWSNMSYCHSSVYVAGATLICARSFTVPVLADGTWSFDLSTLGEGFWHVVSVRQADASGNIGVFEAAASPSNINELAGSKTVVNRYRFRVDRVAPPTPVLAPASNGVTMSVCGADTPFAYSSRLLVFRGSTAGVPVAVVPMPSASQCSQTPTLLVKQNRPGTLPISLPNGVYQVVGESTDPLGRVVRSASLEYRSSWVVPAVSLAITGTVPRPQDSGGPVSAFGEAITLSGVAAYNDVDPSTVKVTVTQNSGDTSYRSSLSTASEILVSDVTVQADGTWSLRLPSTFPIGTFTANVTQGTGTTSAVKFAVTGGSPAIDAVTVRASQQSNGAIVKTLTIRGSAPTDRTLDSTTVSLCGIVMVTNGRWSCSVTGDYADGSTKFTVTSKTSVAYTKSTTTGVWTNGVFSYNVALAPATGLQTSTTTYTTVLSSVLPKPTITTPLPTGSVPITGSVTVSGAAATTTGALPAVTVNVYSGSTATGVASQTATVTAAGSPLVYSKAFTLGDGVWTVQAVQSDGAGNTGVSDPVTIGVDATAPELTISAPLAGARSKSAFITGSLTGSTSRVGPVDYSRFPIDYRPAVYEGTISYYSGLTATGTPALVRPIATEPVTTAWGGGNFSYNYDNKWSDVPALTSGTWTAKVEAADPAGNSTQRLVTFTIDPAATASLLPLVAIRVGDDATLVEGRLTTPAVWSNARIAVSTGFEAGRAPAISGGTVTLFDGDSVLGTASVVDGVATIRVLWSRTTSDYQLKAHYSGDSNYQAVTTPTVPVTAVAPAPTVVRLIPDFPNGAANPGRFTMTVARPVRQENGTTIESACVNGGTATITDGSGRVLSSQSLTDLRQPWSSRYSSVVAGQLDYTTTTLNSPWTTTVGGPQRVTLQTSGGPDCGPSTTTFDVNIPAVPAPSSTISVASPQGSAFIVGDDVAVTFTISGSAPVGLPVSIVDQAGTTVAGPVMFTNTSAWSSPIRYAAGCWRDNSCNPPSIYVHGATATLHFSASRIGNLSFRGVVGGGSSGYTSVAQSFSVPVEPDRIALSLSNTPTRAGENSTVTLGVGGPALQGQVGIFGRDTSTQTPTLVCTSQSCGATSSLPSEMISSGGDAVLNASFQSSITQQTYTVSAPLQRALWQPALTVEAGPGVPVGVTAVASMSEAIRVSWTAPSANASTISGYTVLASPGGATCTTSVDTTCEISGLTNGTEYSFAVVANSNFGASSPAIAWATPTATVIASAPDPASALPAGTVVRDKLVPVRSVLTFPEAMATQFRSSGTVTLSSAPDPVLCAAGSRDETVLAYCANTRHLVTVDLAGLTSTESLMINGIARDLLPADSLKSLNASKSDFVPVTTASWAGNTLTVLTQMYVGGTGFSITGRFNPTPTTFVAPATTRGATTDTDAHIAGAGAPLTKISIASAKITGGWYGPVDSNPSSFYPTVTDFSGWDVRNPRVGETAFVKATLDPVFSVPSDNNVPANLAESVPGAAPLFVPADHGNRFANDRMATSATPARLGGRDSWNPYYGQSALSGLPSCSRCHIWTIRNLETTSPVESGGALPVGTWSLGLITYAPGTGTVSAGSLNERSARVGISTFDLSVDPWTTTLSAQASFSNGSINVVTAARWQGMPIEVQAPYENVMISVFLQRGGVDIPIAICFYNGICLDDDGNGTTFLPTSVTTVGARLAMVMPTATLGFTPTSADTVNVVTSAPWGVTADSGPLALNPPTVVSNSSGGASVLVSSKSMGVTLENQPSLSSPVPLFGNFGWQIADARAALAQFSFDLFKSMFRDATVARIFMSLTQVTLSFMPGYAWLDAVTCGSWSCAAVLVGSSVAGFALRGVSAGIGVLAKGWKAAKSALGIADTPSKIGMYVARAMAPIGRLQTRLAKAVPVRVKEAMSGEASAVSTIFQNYAKAYGKKGLDALYGDDVKSTVIDLLGINVTASVASMPVQPRFWVSGPSDLSFSPSTQMINEMSDLIIAQEANANQAILQNWQSAIQRAYDKALAQPAPETNIGYGTGIGFRLNQFFATIATVSVPNLATLDMAASSIWIGIGENEFGHCDFNGNCAMKPGVSIIVLDGSILVSGLIPGWESGGTYNVEVRVHTVASSGGATNDYLGTSSFTAPGSLYACRAILREMDAIVARQGGYNTERYFGEYSMRYTEDGRWYTFGDPNAGFGLGRIVTSNLRASQDRLCESIELMWEHLHGGIYPDLPAPQYVAPFDPAKQISPQTLSLVGGL